MNRKPVIYALVPAHNEETIISQTIKDLLRQTLPVFIFIIADNCKDETVKIVCSLQKRYPQIFLMETENNESKKAGAINQALLTLDDKVDAILLMDADTRIHPEAVEKAWETLNGDKCLAAVCSKAGVLPYSGRNVSEWLLYRLQRLEYSTFDSQRVETLNSIKVIHGMAALHRWEALKQVNFYDEGNLVEDYDLTIKYKEMGWKVTVELSMRAWTEVPIKWKDWWRQRLRWNRGGMDTLKKHGWNNVTKGYILQNIAVSILTAFQCFILVAFITMIIIHGGVVMHAVVLLAIIFGLASSLYRLAYLEDPEITDLVIRGTIVFEMMYGYIIAINWYHASLLFFLKKKQSW